MSLLTPHIESKWTSFFIFLDIDKDGVITFNDFDILARNFLKSRSLQKSRASKLHNMWLQWWWLIEKSLGENCLEITRTTFIAAMKKLLDGKCPLLRLELEELWESMFDIIDEDRDGHLSEGELAVFYRWHGVDSGNFSQQVFTNLDINRDGEISRDEFRDAMKQFWFGDDPNNDYSFMFSSPASNSKRGRAKKSPAAMPIQQVKKWFCCGMPF